PEQKAEENPELAVGVYSVEYGIKKFGSGGKPTEDDSMAGGVKDGNMIVDVSEKDGQKVYTYYMTVKQAKIMGMDASVTGLQLDGKDIEVYATTEATKAPRVFRFRRTEKEEFFSITSTINGNMPMPAMAVVMKWDTATTEGAAIPEGDTKPEPPAATIPAPIITPAKTEAENGSTVAVTLAMDSQYQAAEIFYTTDGTAPTAASEKYTAPFKVTGSSETKTIKAIAVLDGKSSAVSEHRITFKKASNPGKTDEITDGKYWMDVQFYRADKDAVSMGDYALENNRRALVTVKNGTATIDVATNPIYRDGIVSGIGKIESTDKDVTLTVLDTNTNKEYSFKYVESFQVKLNDLTKKFVNVKFTVPNTPMEKLYPNGVPARLKLDFSGMTKANDSASLKPNSKTASKGGSSDEAFDAEDKETGVKLEAGKFVFNNGAELKAAKLTEAKDKETAEKLLKKKAEYIDLFEIKVMNGKTVATPSGTVKISIPVRKSETAVKLYRILPADKKKSASAAELEFTRSKDGKYLELEVKELGQFAVVYAEADEEAPMDDRTEALMAKESRTDISGHWAESMIRNAMQKGIMTGVGNGDFAPNAAMTRGMLITALGRMEGVKAGMYEGGSFADVKQEDYFASFVAWAVAENIASGMSETVFAPNAEVTREQLAVFLYQYVQKKGIALTGESKTFTDAEGISDWAKDAVAALTGAGLLNGRPDGSFNAKGKATRAEVATVLVKLAEMTAEK
ncbi:S-layer homology domain-containing protein, partial [Anaerotignum faecicola]